MFLYRNWKRKDFCGERKIMEAIMDFKKLESGLYAIKLSPGDDPIKCLSDFAQGEKVGGFFQGIGALKWAELGYFDIETKEYLHNRVDGYFELLSLMGNIVFVDDKPLVHAHIILGKRDNSTIGGHLFSGEVSVTGEIIFIPTDADEIARVKDEFTNLSLWNF